MANPTDEQDPRLPSVEGGWELATFTDGEGPPIDLWVPREPDSLLDDEAVQERSRFNDSMPYWAWMWDSAPIMTRLIGELGVKGRVLEVGAGLGLVGIAVAAANPDLIDLTLSDYDPLSVATLRVNADRNGLPGARVWQLDWREVKESEAEPFDVVIGCDVIYEAQGHGALLDVLERLMNPGSGRALIADPGRTRVPQFLKRAEERGFRVSVLNELGAPANPVVGEFRLLTITR